MKTGLAKPCAIVSLFGVTVFFSFLPLILFRCGARLSETSKLRWLKSTTTLRLINFFSAGVFLGVIFLHLIPMSLLLDHALLVTGYVTNVHLSMLLLTLGMLAFIFLEQILLYSLDQFGSLLQKKKKKDSKTEELKEPSDYTTVPGSDEEGEMSSLPEGAGSVQSGATVPEPDHSHHWAILVLRTYFMVFAISLHAFLEGIALGFQPTSTAVWRLAFALLVHKIVMAFSIGAKLLIFEEAMKTRHFVALVLVFAFASPLGATLGAVTFETMHSIHIGILGQVLSALATGSFIYITFFEVLRPDNDTRLGLLPCFVIAFGLVIVALEVGLNGHENMYFNMSSHLNETQNFGFLDIPV